MRSYGSRMLDQLYGVARRQSSGAEERSPPSLDGLGVELSGKAIASLFQTAVLPQQRTRLVLLASLLGPLELGVPTHSPERHRTVRQTISRLKPVRAGEQSTKDPLHRSSRLTDTNLKRIKQSRPGGCWRDWPVDLVAECHAKKSGATYPSVYGRMEWDRPSPTITTQFFGYGNGRFGHPSQDRAISLREGALLQSFPMEYQFSSPSSKLSFATIGRLIGNAVPVRLGEVIGKAIMEHLENSH